MTIDTEKLAADIAKVLELDGKRTQGDWFWSARTLRSEIKNDEGDIVDTPDILFRTMIGIEAKQSDGDFIVLAPLMADIIRQQQKVIGELESALQVSQYVITKGLSGKYEDINIVAKNDKALALAQPLIKKEKPE